ncbi:MAG: hypothetical protein EKK46_15165 [Rhodocyclaceae bacterium]|nr:MAG: hypothetical protein EKK46_15165 [Rhodocyclaceae bacterium]
MSSKLEQSLRRLEARRPRINRAGRIDGGGYDLSLIPGITEQDKLRVIAEAWGSDQPLLPEAQHAVRKWFSLLGEV